MFSRTYYVLDTWTDLLQLQQALLCAYAVPGAVLMQDMQRWKWEHHAPQGAHKLKESQNKGMTEHGKRFNTFNALFYCIFLNIHFIYIWLYQVLFAACEILVAIGKLLVVAYGS